MRSFRTRSLGTKVTAEEHALVMAAIGDRCVSAWLRDAVLDASRRRDPSDVILAELLALRAIVLTVQFAVATGEPLTTESMHRLIERADHEKQGKARQRLAAPLQE